MLAEVGPVTLTTDPQLFQQRLRELHVQVGIVSPTLLCQAWLWHWGEAWHCRVVSSGSNPCITNVMGVQAEPDWLGAAHWVGVEGMGNADAVPQSPATGQRIPSPQHLSLKEMLFPGICTDSPWNQKSLLEPLLDNWVLNFWPFKFFRKIISSVFCRLKCSLGA